MAPDQISPKSIYKFARKWAQKFLLSHAAVTLNEGQGHSNQFQTIQFNGIYHHAKFIKKLVCKYPQASQS